MAEFSTVVRGWAKATLVRPGQGTRCSNVLCCPWTPASPVLGHVPRGATIWSGACRIRYVTIQYNVAITVRVCGRIKHTLACSDETPLNSYQLLIDLRETINDETANQIIQLHWWIPMRGQNNNNSPCFKSNWKFRAHQFECYLIF